MRGFCHVEGRGAGVHHESDVPVFSLVLRAPLFLSLLFLRLQDGSNALSIALEASHNDTAVLLYAHMNYAKMPASPLVSPPPLGDGF